MMISKTTTDATYNLNWNGSSWRGWTNTNTWEQP